MIKRVVLVLMCLSGSALAAELQAVVVMPEPVEIGTLVSGQVAEVVVQPGQQVKKGDLLVRMDERELKAAEAAAKAGYSKAKALFDEAKREEERSKELYDRTLLSDHELQVAQIDRTKAESLMEESKARLTQASIRLERTMLKSPFDALVVRQAVYSGQMVNNEQQIQPMVQLLPLDQAQISLTLEISKHPGLSVGSALALPGENLNAWINRIEPSPQAGWAQIHATVTAPEAKLRPGQSVTVRVSP